MYRNNECEVAICGRTERTGSSLIVSAKTVDVFVFGALAFMALEHPAHAYIDPGAGTMLWQALVGLFAGSVYYVSRFLSNLKRKKGSPKDGK